MTTDSQTPSPETWDFLILGGRPITEETIRSVGMPVRAFAELVVGSDEAAAQVLASDEFDIDGFVGVMERLVTSDEERDQENFDLLSDFAMQSKDIFPTQFPDLIDGLASSVEPMVRGTSAFSLPYLARVDRRRAVEIWERLLTDTHPKVLEAAILIWRTETKEGSLPPSLGKSPLKTTLGFRDRRQLRPVVRAAESRLAEIGRPLPK